jgi:lysophospholipase L1-like esterase
MMMGGSDRDGLGRYAEADRKLGPPQAGKVRVVFLGDSITDVWPLAEDFPERDFVNRGISGQTLPQMLVRTQADVIDLQPAAMIVLAGTNDINARPAPFKAIVDNFKMIATLAEAHRITPLFASLLPVSAYHKDVNPRWDRTQGGKPENILAVNKLLQEFCQQHNYIYVDYFSAVVDNAGFFKAELSDDGVHPNRQGFKVLAPVALKALDQALQQSRAGR